LQIVLPPSIAKRLISEITLAAPNNKLAPAPNNQEQLSPRGVISKDVKVDPPAISHPDLSQRVTLQIGNKSPQALNVRVKGYMFNKEFKIDKNYTTYALPAASKVKELLKKLESERMQNKVNLNICKYKDDGKDYNTESLLSNHSKWTIKSNPIGTEFTVYFINPLALSDDK